MSTVNVKNFSSSYLYNKAPEYEKKVHQFLLQADRIDKKDSNFEDVIYQIKNRQKTTVLLDVLKSENVILMHSTVPLPRAFKIIFAIDPKDNVRKTFIDCSECLRLSGSKWDSPSIDVLVAYLISAMNTQIYNNLPTKYTMNSTINKSGAEIFSKLFTSIIDYLFKINIVEASRDNCLYLTSMYYLTCLLEKDPTAESTKGIAIKVANISERQAQVVDLYVDEHSYDNIKNFIDTLAKALKIERLTLETFIEKWIYLYGSGTHFATELFPSFSSMITDSYVGAYINNQKTIEKVAGSTIVDFTNATFAIGQSVINNDK